MKKFAYNIAWTNGVMRPVSGYRLSENFAARCEWDGLWTLTHLPTGYAIHSCASKTLKALRILAPKIERVRDWESVSEGSRIPMKHKYAVVKLARGKAHADHWRKETEARERAERARKRKAA
jgi:hypothetical protein